MKMKIRIVVLLLVAGVVSCHAADMKWQPRNVKFADAALVGNTVLPAGEYKVEHRVNGDEHIMVFTNVDDKNVRAESKCHMVRSQRKELRSVQAFELVNGQQTLKTLIFKGDTFVHELY